ncbi:hypothetical protein [Streptomyces aureus]|uniref:hypothetical protein n=1 Tax=Streptomyces aureus TaxID=193461 RepID=UPI0031DEA00A
MARDRSGVGAQGGDHLSAGAAAGEDLHQVARGATPDVEAHLRHKIVKLKETISNKYNELNRLRADVPALVRVINQLTLENQELRNALTRPHPNVVPIQRKRLPPDE